MNKTLLVPLLAIGLLVTPQLSFKAACDPPRDPNARRPRGVRVSVSGYFAITDSSDGVRDNRVEAFGYLNLNGQRAWTQNRKSAPSRGHDIIFIKTLFDYDVIFNDSSTWKLRITGYMKDYDKGSDDDAMWNSPLRTRTIDLKPFADSSAVYNRGSDYVVAGDHDSESADLRLHVGGEYIY